MTTHLLRTKLYAPAIRREFVSRPRLIDKLNSGLHGKLTLVSAPAGFGKSALLSEWIGQCGRLSAWLSLDEADNKPDRFWTYFVTALQSAEPSLGAEVLSLLDSGHSPPAETVLADLTNELVRLSSPTVLVLDDFHHISDPSIHQGINFLLDHLPRNLHLVVSGRADPLWPVARLRAMREMNELRAHHLRFSAAEAASFLNDAMHLNLAVADVAALEERTEGWMAGLQMAAISMQGLMRRHGSSDLSSFVEAFAASNRFIFDYLVEEVLEQQTAHVQTFLLETCVLERLSASLCDAVRNAHDSADMLQQIERSNLLLIPLDEERAWYRYHHLFGQLLRARMLHDHPEQLPALNLRASQWYERNGWVVQAVSQALAAGDVDRVARLITGNALAILGRGELRDLAHWLAGLPKEIRSQPWLTIAHA